MTPAGSNTQAEGRSPHDVATDWFLREDFGRMTPADREALEDWLEADLAHRQAWQDVRMAVETISDGAADQRLMAMRTAALAVRPESNWRAGGLIAAGLVACVVVGLSFRGVGSAPAPEATPSVAASGPATESGSPDGALYRTAIGERAAFTLPDGSVATLDTDSLLRVSYTARARRVRLLRGQALFNVAKHKARPFQVDAADRRITAVGTTFNVRLDGAGSKGRVSVALLEGVVRVASLSPPTADAPPAFVSMVAGEVLVASASAPIRVTAGDTERAASWRSGVLTFSDVPLDRAVAEMNRYTTRPIGLADARLAELHISGVFNSSDPEHFAETIAEVLPVRVDQDGAGNPLLKMKN